MEIVANSPNILRRLLPRISPYAVMEIALPGEMAPGNERFTNARVELTRGRTTIG